MGSTATTSRPLPPNAHRTATARSARASRPSSPRRRDASRSRWIRCRSTPPWPTASWPHPPPWRLSQRPPGRARGAPQRRGRGWQAAVAIAAVIAVLLVAVAVVRPDRTTAIASASTTQRLVEFSGSGEGELAVAFTPGESGAVLWGSNLPDPGQDKVYEIWMFQDGTPVSGGCFRPQDGQVALSVDASLAGSRGDGPHRRTRGLSIESVGRSREDGKPDPGLARSSLPRTTLPGLAAPSESLSSLNPRLHGP